jgi:DNA-binding transcriptional LysR family regulator
MDLNALREFVAVAREGSFAKAAAALNTPKSTVSKRVQDLEGALGVRLVERTTRQLRLTGEGAALLPRAERILADAREAARIVTSARSEAEGQLRIRMPPLFAQAFAGRIIADCRATYPGIVLEIVVLDRPVDLMAEGFDGAITIGPLGDSGQAARVLAEDETIPVASPSLIERHRMPIVPDDLKELPALILNTGNQASWTLTRDGEPTKTEVRAVVSVNSMPVLKDAALAGVGIAYLPTFLVQECIDSGALLRLLPDWHGLQVPISFTYPSPHSVTSRLRAFIDVLVAQFPDRTLPELRA